MESKKGSAKKVSIIIVVIALLILIFSVLSSRFTPSTDQARVQGLTLSLAPMVSGYVTKVNVSLHSEVKAGDTLFIIDRTPYEIAVKQAEINLENVTQSLTAGMSGLKGATAQLNSARVSLERAKKNWERTQRVMAQNEGAFSQVDRDRSESSYLTAVERVKTAQANLDGQKAALGPTDANNPSVKAVLNQLEKANWDLAHTVITAPSDGIIESFNVETGYFASAGRPIATLISNKTIWIQANFTENNLTHLKVNDKASITFDIDAGEVYDAKVVSIAYGVKTQTTSAGNLPTVRNSKGWLLEQQRFPVIIALEDEEVYKKLRQGSQADVVVFTGNSSILNTLAKIKIWFISKISYVR
ncbi:multidrug resistance efflux pump [Jejuia pallidilutea]|jgi:multidrug resistance efflux pump|uniref:Multidrug resistance efflux pump n=1 Tax=Jejuia pallidilutea TaxID=504487 RepID=A0A362WYF2_9FLAO|nr:HlyD family secretion protein [Jejuia pallidilutea]PQV46942.1 multidrug resistance efflux pump [Jejuia pallidilutea]